MSYYVNGADVQESNWMRYVNCSRTEEEQNLVAYQYRGEIFYRAYKDIQAGELFLQNYMGLFIDVCTAPLLRLSQENDNTN